MNILNKHRLLWDGPWMSSINKPRRSCFDRVIITFTHSSCCYHHIHSLVVFLSDAETHLSFCSSHQRASSSPPRVVYCLHHQSASILIIFISVFPYIFIKSDSQINHSIQSRHSRRAEPRARARSSQRMQIRVDAWRGIWLSSLIIHMRVINPRNLILTQTFLHIILV